MPTDVLDAVAQETGRGGLRLAFTADLEMQYRHDWIENNNETVCLNLFVALILASTFIISDYFVANASFTGFLIARFGVTLPICLLCIISIKHKRRHAMILACVVPITMAAALSFMLAISDGAYRSTYLFGDIILMIAGCVLIRPLLRHAIVTVGLQYIFYQSLVLLPGLVRPEDRIVSSLFGLSGAIVPILAVFALEQSSRRNFMTSFRVKLLNEQLKALSLTDPLTQLGNRRAFEEATGSFWATTTTAAPLASFIMIDIDRFKSFNDNYGHPAGDFCLSTIGRVVAGTVRGSRDLAFRFGGEEFLVFLPDTDFAEARQIAENIRLAILKAAIPHPALATDAVVSISLGIAAASIKDATPLALIGRADMALYAAKHNGRNQIWPPLEKVPLDAVELTTSAMKKVA